MSGWAGAASPTRPAGLRYGTDVAEGGAGGLDGWFGGVPEPLKNTAAPATSTNNPSNPKPTVRPSSDTHADTAALAALTVSAIAEARTFSNPYDTSRTTRPPARRMIVLDGVFAET
jgi:hypothetical protein